MRMLVGLEEKLRKAETFAPGMRVTKLAGPLPPKSQLLGTLTGVFMSAAVPAGIRTAPGVVPLQPALSAACNPAAVRGYFLPST